MGGAELSASQAKEEAGRVRAAFSWAGPRRREEGERAAWEKIEEQAGLGQKKEEGDRESSFFSIFFFVFLISKPISNINQTKSNLNMV